MDFQKHLTKRLFTTAAVDNIDYNSFLTSATDSFHGTGIFLFSNTPNLKVKGEDGVTEHVISAETKKLWPLPEYYANVPSVMCKKVESPAPQKSDQFKIINFSKRLSMQNTGGK